MYLTPTANNPSGHVMTDAQKQEVYDIACEFNLLILEDDPYYFINFEEVAKYMQWEKEKIKIIFFRNNLKVFSPWTQKTGSFGWTHFQKYSAVV